MSSYSTYICRLCFGIDDISVGEIEDIHKEILDVLLINIDWSLTETSTLCENCCKKLHESFTFKANCIDIEDYLTPMKDNGKLDLREVCTLPKHSKAVDIICRLCVEWIDNQEVTLTEIEKERFKLYLPEIVLESTSNPVICSVCYDSFQSCLSFTESCIQNEQKLVDYCKKLKITIESPIFLNEFLEYLKSPNSSTRVGHLNRKVRSEKLDEYKCDVHSDKKCVCCSCSSLENHECRVEQVVAKHMSLHQKSKKTMYKCHHCQFETYRKHCLNKHLQKHDINSDLKIFTKEEHISKLANRTQKCSYTPYLRHHTKMHLDPSQVEMFKCDECPFESKWARKLKKHKIMHRKPSEVNMFKCDECSFESKWAHCIAKHKKVHRKPSELNMFKCEECPFESKWAYSLSTHKNIHRKSSEVNMFKCDECPFESKWAHSVSKHKKIHRKPSEVNMFKCEECPFESRWKYNLSIHKKIHRKPSQVNMFKCDECPYESRWGSNLTNHKKVHRKPSEVNMFKCEECPFKSKWSTSLISHKKIHRKPSEARLWK